MYIPEVTSPDLSAEEQDLADRLHWRITEEQPFLYQLSAYYDGTQRMRHLGISIPPELEPLLRAATGWPRVIVDAIRYKLRVSGFRLAQALDADSGLWESWTANRMRAKAQMAHLAALKYGRAFLMAGTGGPRGLPLLTAESPASMAADFDAATMEATAALQLYRFWGQDAAALYLPDQTVHLIRPEGSGAWQLRERDRHNLGRCPVVMLSNRSELEDLYGQSEITPEVRSITDVACRRLVGMDVSAEFFSSPQRYVIGASMSSFEDAEGNALNAWETYAGRIWGMERDEEGNVPSVGQFAANSPEPFVTMLQFYARMMSAVSRVPPHRFGLATDNPVSAEAIVASDAELDELAVAKSESFDDAWCQLMQLERMIANGGTLPEEAAQLEVLWDAPSPPVPATMSQAILAQVQSGAMPPTSDVALARLGYTPLERARIVADRKAEASKTNLTAIAEALSTGSLRASLGSDIGTAANAGAKAAPAPAAQQGTGGKSAAG